MTKSLISDYGSIADILQEVHNYNPITNQGIDTIELIGRYEMVIKLIEDLGLIIDDMPLNNGLFDKVNYEIEQDKEKRLKKDDFKPIIERVKLPKVNPNDKNLFIGIIRNTPTVFNIAKYHKKAKDTYCKLVFAGLHQPTKPISSEAIKIISRFLKRKTFNLHSVDIAIDTEKEDSISFKDKRTFRDNLMPLSKNGVISKGSSLYINKIDHLSISRVIYYDKYKKQLKLQGEEKIGEELKAWRRLEVTFTFDVTKKKNKGFIHYIESMDFIDNIYEVHALAQKVGINSYEDDYLTYQVNSFIDNRFINNHESKEQFNSVEALERFKTSDFRRYTLPI